MGALCVAVVAFAASVVAAVGPADEERAQYTWPTTPVPALSPEEGWFAPLPLLNRVPSAIEIELPCGLAPPIRAASSVVILSTTRRSQSGDGLLIALTKGRVRALVGDVEVASAPWPESCPLAIGVEDGEVRVLDRKAAIRAETPGRMPIVSGFFTRLNLREGAPPRVTLQTRVYATSPSTRQLLAAGFALLLAIVALVLVSRSDGPRAPHRLRRYAARAWSAREPSDVVVISVLVVWWIVAPVFYDDGWLWRDDSEISLYYDNWGISSPLGHWLFGLEHWVTGATNHLVLARLPTLLILLAAWPVCRMCLRSSVQGELPRSARWTLAAAFLIGAMAWGMTLRPEPFVAFLTLVCLTAMVSFANAPRLTPLALAIPAVVLAVTAHTTGIVAVAPILASSHHLWRFLRAPTRLAPTGLAALVLAGIALGLVVGTIDSDLGSRVADARLVSEGELHDEPFWAEYRRYTLFDVSGGGVTLRRLSLGLLLLCVAAMLTRRRSAASGVRALPASSVAIGLLLLGFVPSKWPWHFGALAAIAAVAISAEVTSLARERGSRYGSVRALVLSAVVALIGLWAWLAPYQWSRFDLQRLNWGLGFNILPWLIAPALLMGIAVRTRRRARREGRAPSFGGGEWMLSVVSLGAVAITIAMLVADAAISRWAPARQNVEVLAARESCGLAHRFSGDPRLVERLRDPSTRTLLVPDLVFFFPCATTPGIEEGLVELPQLVISRGEPWPLYGIDSPFAAVADLYDLRQIARGPRSTQVQAVDDEVAGFANLEVRADSAVDRDYRPERLGSRAPRNADSRSAPSGSLSSSSAKR